MLFVKAYICAAIYYVYRLYVVQSQRYTEFARVNAAAVNPAIRVISRNSSRGSFEKYSDKELLDAVYMNNQQAIVYLFYRKCLPTFQYHICKLFPHNVEMRDLIDEFFLYLFEDDWRRLRTFDVTRASLSTWMSVTSFRFFKSYKHSKIDSNGVISVSDKWESFVGDWIQSSDAGLMMDINEAINTIANSRDRDIAKLLFIEDKEFNVVADRFGLSTDYVYTVKNRLVKQLKVKLSSYL